MLLPGTGYGYSSTSNCYPCKRVSGRCTIDTYPYYCCCCRQPTTRFSRLTTSTQHLYDVMLTVYLLVALLCASIYLVDQNKEEMLPRTFQKYGVWSAHKHAAPRLKLSNGQENTPELRLLTTALPVVHRHHVSLALGVQ